MSAGRPLRLGSWLLLAGLWVLMWGSWSIGTFVLGLVVSAVVLLVFPMPRAASRVRVRPLALLWLTGTFLADLVRSSIVVSWMALRPGGVGRGAVMAIRLHDDDDLRSTIVVEMTSLVPGTVVIDLDPTGRVLLHVIDTDDPVRLRAEAERVHRLERRVARAFGAPPPPGCGTLDDGSVA